MKIELYIAGQLCDLEKADLGIRLKRQLFNPKELNTKDVQKSYSVTLPATARNNAIFKHKNVEETVGKFTTYPNASLYVDGLLIMEGKFRLTGITRNSYRGNLGVPTPLTAKDVFGERKMNDVGEWLLEDFQGEKSLTQYNTTLTKEGDPQPCIFPLVLYGLLPNTNGSNKPIINDTTKFKLTDFPPSVNCIQMLEHFFKSADYKLSGTALEDERLKNLYVSYRNPNEYPMPFEATKVAFSGSWSNFYNGKFERKVKINKHTYLKGKVGDEGREETDNSYVSCNLFRSDNFHVDEDSIINETHQLVRSGGNQLTYTVPHDGLYKIDLQATISLGSFFSEFAKYYMKDIDGEKLGVFGMIYRRSEFDDYFTRAFSNVACELKLIRHEDPIYELSNETMDNVFYRNNQDQEVGAVDAKFPKSGCVNFIDPAQNENLLCGFSWGRVSWNNKHRTVDHSVIDFVNPLWVDKQWCNPLAIKHGNTWGEDPHLFANSAVHSPGYKTKDNTPYLAVDLRDEQTKTVAIAQANLYDNLDSKNKEGNHMTAGDGHIQQVVWLSAGESISLLAQQDRAQDLDWIIQNIDFSLSIEPFTKTTDWLTMNDDGSSDKPMNWSDKSLLLKNQIDLAEFLPIEMKIDDWISNFCKVFNLNLTHVGDKSFELNVKQRDLVKNTSYVIDLDSKASVGEATSESLSLPRAYKLGFTVGTAEEGYVDSLGDEAINEGDTGGGTFYTGSEDGNDIEQKSNFSHCWYKTLKDQQTSSKQGEVFAPVITEHEIWKDGASYNEMKKKQYFNKAQRFWYKSNKTHPIKVHKTDAKIALVSNVYDEGGANELWLNYEDKPNSIMREFFTLVTNDKEYTVVECYLSPEEYAMLNRAFVRFNCDLYNVVEADGFDPSGRSKTKLKLIKKI